MDFGQFEEFWRWLSLTRLTNDLDTYETETRNHQRRYGSAADAPTRALVCWTGMRGMVEGPTCKEHLAAFHGRIE